MCGEVDSQSGPHMDGIGFNIDDIDLKKLNKCQTLKLKV